MTRKFHSIRNLTVGKKGNINRRVKIEIEKNMTQSDFEYLKVNLREIVEDWPGTLIYLATTVDDKER